ncbi:MAG: TonB-dependent receptor plug domain-containing protein [Opitutaceae bacterium]|nr:TonB-dependent receptor plug domain-containing protein [Opitutaceae bacterium]
MTKPLFFPSLRILTSCLPAAMLFTGSLSAQQTATARPENDEAVRLSPFTVTSDGRGYLATNALSGTRLNTSLEDIASSISVVTKLQLEDTAANDINDVFLYEVGTEGTGQFTAMTPNRDGGVNDDVQANPQTANRIRGLGSANVAIGNFASNPNIPLDLYNIEAIEISRGPNSNIFGLGSGAGAVNLVPAYARLSREITTVTARVDDRGGYRGSFDFNRPLFSKKLAIRVAGVWEDKGFELEPSREEIRRGQFSLFYQPFRRTTLKASVESYRNTAQRPNALTPRQTVTDWRAAGEPTWNPVTRMVTLSNGTTSGPFTASNDSKLPLGLWAQGNGFYQRTPLFVEPDGSITYWGVNRTGNLAGAPTPRRWTTDLRMLQSGTDLRRDKTNFPLFFEPGVSDKSLYDWSSINYVAPNYVQDKATTYMAELEQFLIETPRHLLAARAGYFRQDFERYERDMIGENDTIIFVDVNERLLDGSPNPNFRRPYVGANSPLVLRTPEYEETISGDLVYQLTPEQSDSRFDWLGRQRLNLHAERRSQESVNYRYNDFIASDHAWITPSNRSASTTTYFQYYLGDKQGQNIDYAPTSIANLAGTYPFTWFNAQTNQWVVEQARLGEVPVSNTRTRTRYIDSANVTYQGNFIDDRLVATAGYRRDEQGSNTSDAWTIDPATGLYSSDSPALRNFPTADSIQKGNTYTLGGVIKATPWLRFYYNWADSFSPEAIRYDINGIIMPNPTSKGQDFGIGVSLLDGKLALRVNRYQVREIKARLSQLGTVGSRTHVLEGGRQQTPQSFLGWAIGVIRARYQQQGITASEDQIYDKAATELVKLDPAFLRQTDLTGAVGVAGDRESKGWEIEAVYNPLPNWRIKFNAAQQKSVDSNIGGDLEGYFERRLPVWMSAKDDQGNLWWTANNNYAMTQWLGSIRAPYLFEVANNGKSRAQVREWRWNALTNYDFTEGRLKNWSIGGAVRWEDKSAIGYLGRAPENGVILELDPEKPIFDKARYYFDFSVGYRFKLASDRIRIRTQLNVRNAFESGRLQPVAVNPLGQPTSFRIIDPRLFILTTTFDF